VVPFWPFVLGVAIVATPAALLKEDDAKVYTGLILLMFAVYHWAGLAQASTFVQRELRRKA
jgi:hypothetical protein